MADEEKTVEIIEEVTEEITKEVTLETAEEVTLDTTEEIIEDVKVDASEDTANDADAIDDIIDVDDFTEKDAPDDDKKDKGEPFISDVFDKLNTKYNFKDSISIELIKNLTYVLIFTYLVTFLNDGLLALIIILILLKVDVLEWIINLFRKLFKKNQ